MARVSWQVLEQEGALELLPEFCCQYSMQWMEVRALLHVGCWAACRTRRALLLLPPLLLLLLLLPLLLLIPHTGLQTEGVHHHPCSPCHSRRATLCWKLPSHTETY